MLFRRLKPPGWRERISLAFWPRRSFRRSVAYFAKRAMRLSATPHAVAAGIASGVGVSFVPLPGSHFVLAAAVAWCLSGNILASALGTAVGNPLLLPLMWGASFEVGRAVLRGEAVGGIEPLPFGATLFHLSFGQLWAPVIKPMLVGAIPLGLVSGLAVYVLTRWAVSAFQTRRRKRLADRSAAWGPSRGEGAAP